MIQGHFATPGDGTYSLVPSYYGFFCLALCNSGERSDHIVVDVSLRIDFKVSHPNNVANKRRKIE